LLNKTIEQNQKAEIPITEGLNRIEISIQNEIAGVSIFYWTSFVDGKESSENTIGPQKYRTTELEPKNVNKDETIRNDRKTIVLNTGDADRITISVEKGKVNIQAKPSKRRM
jgi:hypothetical protein